MQDHDDRPGRDPGRGPISEPYGDGQRAETYDAEFGPENVELRQSQLADRDPDGDLGRDDKALPPDKDRRRGGEDSGKKLHEDFDSWRQGRPGGDGKKT